MPFYDLARRLGLYGSFYGHGLALLALEIWRPFTRPVWEIARTCTFLLHPNGNAPGWFQNRPNWITRTQGVRRITNKIIMRKNIQLCLKLEPCNEKDQPPLE